MITINLLKPKWSGPGFRLGSYLQHRRVFRGWCSFGGGKFDSEFFENMFWGKGIIRYLDENSYNSTYGNSTHGRN